MADHSSENGDQRAKETKLALVEEHVQQENHHALEAIMATFGKAPEFEDTPWEDHYTGRKGVRTYYEELLGALPDLNVDIHRRHVTEGHVILEVIISGTHTGTWRGLPATGRPVEIPLCAVYSFDQMDQLSGERIFYDRATVLRQLGMFREPDRGLGRILTPLLHPLVTIRALLREIGGR